MIVTVVLTCGNKIIIDDADQVQAGETVFSVMRETGGYFAAPTSRLRYWTVDV